MFIQLYTNVRTSQFIIRLNTYNNEIIELSRYLPKRFLNGYSMFLQSTVHTMVPIPSPAGKIIIYNGVCSEVNRCLYSCTQTLEELANLL